MGNPSPLQLEEIFFPLQEVKANPEHNPSGERSGTRLKQSFQTKPIEDRKNVWAADLIIESDQEASINPPYLFKLHAFALIRIDPSIEPEASKILVDKTALSVLVGATRERLIELTSRAPWGRFTMGLVAE
jgi:hypothetical protein